MRRELLIGCMLALLASCGNQKTGNIIPEGSDAPPVEDSTAVGGQADQNPANPEVIAERVNAIYQAVAEAYPEITDISPSNDELDAAFCSSEWNTLVEMVNSKDAETLGREGFFDTDYWIMGQDWGKISISDLKIDVKDSQHADASFKLHNLGSATSVTLEMVFERGEWLISNFIDNTHKFNWKKSMMKHIEEKGKALQEEAADDGIIEYDIE